MLLEWLYAHDKNGEQFQQCVHVRPLLMYILWLQQFVIYGVIKIHLKRRG